jgi:S-adenosylmethionine/arginine decarboxylase-like enzyme
MVHTKGTHSMLDITEFYVSSNDALPIFNLMKQVILDNTKMKIVNEAITVFDDNDPNQEAGWTSVFLLDASHCSLHSYSRLGLLAVDVFSCKSESDNNDTRVIIDKFCDELHSRYGHFNISFTHHVDRFHY